MFVNEKNNGMSDAELNQFLFKRKCLTKLNLNVCLPE